MTPPEPKEIIVMEPFLLSAANAAKALGGISPELLKTLPVSRVRLGKRVLYRTDDLRAYIEACTYETK